MVSRSSLGFGLKDRAMGELCCGNKSQQRLKGFTFTILRDWGALTINLGRLPLSCRDFVFEEQINLAERAVFGFWETEVTPDIAEKIGARPEKP